MFIKVRLAGSLGFLGSHEGGGASPAGFTPLEDRHAEFVSPFHLEGPQVAALETPPALIALVFHPDPPDFVRLNYRHGQKVDVFQADDLAGLRQPLEFPRAVLEKRLGNRQRTACGIGEGRAFVHGGTEDIIRRRLRRSLCVGSGCRIKGAKMNLEDEFKAAGVFGLPFSWGDDGQCEFADSVTEEQRTAVRSVVARWLADLPVSRAWEAIKTERDRLTQNGG